MAELTISADDIQSAIEEYVSSFTADTSREEVGTVIDAGDGIAHVEGLPSVMTQELLEFPGGVLGVALNLDEHSIGAVILGDFEKIEEGQQVKRTGDVLSVPVGDAFLGRVVNPLGQPIDGRGDIETETRRALELQAPSVVQRQGVKEPLQTGIKAIDAMTPIGRGQRQLIIGDRKTGKTAVCVDTILNQRQNWETRRPEEAGALRIRGHRAEGHHDRHRAARAGGGRRDGLHHHRRGAGIGCRGLQMACAVYGFGDRPALDVRRQARADRLRRPDQAGRGIPRDLAAAAPSRRAARPIPATCSICTRGCWSAAAKLSDELGGGSLTGLPIIETKANDISAYIPTNVISITDGQCFLETDLFNQGVRPAINVGVSVSRVGGAAQIKAMKEVAGSSALGPVAVPRIGGLRRLRFRPGRHVEGAIGARRAAGRAAQATASSSRCPLRSKWSRSSWAPAVTWTRCPSKMSGGSKPNSWTTCGPPKKSSSKRSARLRSSARKKKTS